MNSKSPRFSHVVVSGSLALTFALIFAGGACGGGGGSSETAGHAGGATGTAGALGTAGATATAGATGSAGAAANTPVALCNQVVATYCRRQLECEPSDAGLTMATCNELFQVAFRCAGATDSTDLGTCNSDVAGDSCTSLFDATTGSLPGSCMKALTNIPITDAQNKCLNLVDVLCDPVDICNNVTPTDTTDFTACEDDGVQQLGCLFVTGETTTYPACISDLCTTAADAGTNADGGVTLPASCNDLNVLTFPPGTTTM